MAQGLCAFNLARFDDSLPGSYFSAWPSASTAMTLRYGALVSCDERLSLLPSMRYLRVPILSTRRPSSVSM